MEIDIVWKLSSFFTGKGQNSSELHNKIMNSLVNLSMGNSLMSFHNAKVPVIFKSQVQAEDQGQKFPKITWLVELIVTG